MQKLVLGFFLSISILGINLSQVREKYPKAWNSPEITEALFTSLSALKNTDNKVLFVYKGAVLTLKAKHAKGVKDKKAFFKEGATLIESAINTSPDNLEMRFIRMTVQENAPKIVRYNKEIEKDKRFVLDNYTLSDDKVLKKIIKQYINTSTLFTEEEKQLF